MKTPYANLKTHFDTMILGERRAIRPNGFESIRDTYYTAYGKKVGIFDIFTAKIGCHTNPIDFIATFMGPVEKTDEFHNGLNVDANSVVFAHAMPESFIGGIGGDDIAGYIGEVYSTMEFIISNDKFYGTDKLAQENLLICTNKALPFYLTFHHVRCLIEKNCIYGDRNDFINKANDCFMSLLTKYIASSDEDSTAICTSLVENKFSDDISEIYSQMTCKDTLELFL